jgi:hypothetical protein
MSRAISASPLKADITERRRHVRFVPKVDIRCFIRSSRRRVAEWMSEWSRQGSRSPEIHHQLELGWRLAR